MRSRTPVSLLDGRLALVRTVETPESESASPPTWSVSELAGRFVEISGAGASAALTQAVALVLDAQRRGDPVAWVTPAASAFYPPDLDASGVDLDALVVIRVAVDPRDLGRRAARAAEHLLRSGSFALIVIDLARVELPIAIQGRLVGLAQKHDAVIACTTEKSRDAASLGSLVSLRVVAERIRCANGFRAGVEATKDKRRGPGWNRGEGFRGPDGLR